MTKQAATTLQNNVIIEEIEASRKQELEFLDVVSKASSELEIGPLLQKIMETITKMLDADRSTLFINDEKQTNYLQKLAKAYIRHPIRFPIVSELQDRYLHRGNQLTFHMLMQTFVLTQALISKPVTSPNPFYACPYEIKPAKLLVLPKYSINEAAHLIEKMKPDWKHLHLRFCRH